MAKKSKVFFLILYSKCQLHKFISKCWKLNATTCKEIFKSFFILIINMNYIEKMINNCKYIYSEINAATLTGAIDVVVVEQPDGTFTCSPFHVRFGKMGVLRSKEKIVDIEINGEPVDIHMKLGESGEAFFVEEVLEEEEDVIPPHLATSPIPPDGDRCFPPPTEWRIDEPPLEEVSVLSENALTGSTVSESGAKLFKAETVEENAESQRKLSAPDFRPIDNRSSDTGSSSKESLSVSFNKEDSPSGDEGTGGNSSTNASGKKRGRRKRSTKKRQPAQMQANKDVAKKNNQVPQIQEQPAKQPPPVVETDIFTMDDLDTNISSEMSSMSTVLPELESRMRHLEMASLNPNQLERDIHFFSDTEITPGSSPREDYSSGGPVQSDTEFETNKDREDGNVTGVVDDTKQSWKWGELPTTSASPDLGNKHQYQKWMVNMLGFMKKTKHIRHENEGVYLSELNFDDPEISSLYLSTLQAGHQINSEDSREEDAESGNGPSLPQSPHSVEGGLCCQKACMHLPLNYPQKTWPVDLAMSLCGPGASVEQFNSNLVSYSDFISDPFIMFNSKLVVRFEGQLLTWKQAAPVLASLVFFKKPLPQEIMSKLTEEEPVSTELENKNPDPSQPNNKSQATSKKTSKSWFSSWRKNGEEPIQEEVKEELGKTTPENQRNEDLPVETAIELQEQPLDLSLQQPVKEETEENKKESSNTPPTSEKYRKTLRLTSKQIELLNLEPGANEVEFSVTTAYQGTSKCKCYLFRWRYDDKIVISDIDGTITRSDVLGHLLPIVGKDWAQSGVAKLFTRIKENGYKLLYLSARAIGQSRLTRDYLKSIKQEDLNLPEGPVLLNPISLLHAFHTEVIEKKPEEFKISCLRDIQALFPIQAKPFYAGYGNKINDVWAYQAVGIPIFRIFTINHRGELKHELTETFQSTYSSMSNLVDQMFPLAKPNSIEYDFSEFVYWRDPIPDISTLPDIV